MTAGPAGRIAEGGLEMRIDRRAGGRPGRRSSSAVIASVAGARRPSMRLGREGGGRGPDWSSRVWSGRVHEQEAGAGGWGSERPFWPPRCGVAVLRSVDIPGDGANQGCFFWTSAWPGGAQNGFLRPRVAGAGPRKRSYYGIGVRGKGGRTHRSTEEKDTGRPGSGACSGMLRAQTSCCNLDTPRYELPHALNSIGHVKSGGTRPTRERDGGGGKQTEKKKRSKAAAEYSKGARASVAASIEMIRRPTPEAERAGRLLFHLDGKDGPDHPPWGWGKPTVERSLKHPFFRTCLKARPFRDPVIRGGAVATTEAQPHDPLGPRPLSAHGVVILFSRPAPNPQARGASHKRLARGAAPRPWSAEKSTCRK